MRAGDVLIQAGEPDPRFFVMKSGQAEVVRPSNLGDIRVVVHAAGAFTGEANMILGRRSIMRTSVTEPGEVIELTRDQLLSLIQTDTEIADVVMRAFIYRRLELVAQGIGDVVLVGSMHSGETLRIREFLTRNGHPFAYMDLDKDPDVQHLLDQFSVAVAEIPVLICRGDALLKNPTNEAIADCLGFNAAIETTHQRDVLVVGRRAVGPRGGRLRRVGRPGRPRARVERAGRTGRDELAYRKLPRLSERRVGRGTDVAGARRRRRSSAPRSWWPAARRSCPASASRTASGWTTAPACRQRPSSSPRARNTASPRSTTCRASSVTACITARPRWNARSAKTRKSIVVGGGNSAGQAAMFLSEKAKHVHMLVRSENLSASMSRYLIRRIEESPRITLRTRTEITALDGDGRLERVCWRDGRSGAVEPHDIRHVFLMTGGVPNAVWLRGCVALDAQGFVKTGPDLTSDDLAAAGWPLSRPPHLLETSLPGVFAVGDVRGNSVKRVASAVGEGSIAISFVHRVLAE